MLDGKSSLLIGLNIMEGGRHRIAKGRAWQGRAGLDRPRRHWIGLGTVYHLYFSTVHDHTSMKIEGVIDKQDLL